ncbi:MAG TPA: NUDIX hydrolase [Methanofastidiosum sp.]|nr:NUDIX hydrolase [Methanofastidiosum sp.]HNU61626.1 NUDIX hydrolase [Methanofastidiosum sp.]HOI77566.1 NUDIX hydrolase [Methanofastidiosum sp.]
MSENKEYLPVVIKEEDILAVCGFVRRDIVHSSLRIPHISVNIIPIIRGTEKTILQKRSKKRKIDPSKYDFNGGHVTYEPVLLSDDPKALEHANDKTALRETREEIAVSNDGMPYVFSSKDLIRFTKIGEFLTGFNIPDSINVGYMTGYILFIPFDSKIIITDENEDGTIEELSYEKIDISEVVSLFKENPLNFACGATAVLKELSNTKSDAYFRFWHIVNLNKNKNI